MIERLKETFAKLPKWAWLAIAGGVLLLFVFVRRSPTVVASQVPADVGGDTKASNNEVIAMINAAMTNLDQKYAAQMDDLEEGIGTTLTGLAGTVQTLQTNTAKNISDLAGAIAQSNNDTRNQLEMVQDNIRALTAVPKQVWPTSPAAPAQAVVSSGVGGAVAAAVSAITSIVTGSSGSSGSSGGYSGGSSSSSGGSSSASKATGGAVPKTDSYTLKQGAIEYDVDAHGNIYKNNTYVAVTGSNQKYIPQSVLDAARKAKAG